MRISSYFYKKFLISFLICLFSSVFIFYIFSLIGNLGENLSFTLILYLTFLNSLQILSYVPSFIVLMAIILFITSLRSKNELIIFREYLSINKILLITFPLVIIFGLIQINNKLFSDKIESFKLNLLNSEDSINTKVIISYLTDTKVYTILKGVDYKNSRVHEYHKYKIRNNKIVGGEYSNQVKLVDNKIYTNNYTKFTNKKIDILEEKNVILNDSQKIFDKKLVVRENNFNKYLNFNFYSFIDFFYFNLFYLSIFLILLSRKAIDHKQNLNLNIFLCFLILFYSILMSGIKVKLFNFEMHTLSSLLIFLIFLKFYKYE